jgi:predicted nucleic acid-binding protein
MSGRAFLDTNVLVYALGRHEDRTPTADALLAAGGLVSVQVLNELAAVARGKLRLPWPDVMAALEAIRTLCPSPVPITLETHDAAARLAVRHGFHIYDALTIAAALSAGCDTLYSEGLRDGQTIDGRLTIRNPFKSPEPGCPSAG